MSDSTHKRAHKRDRPHLRKCKRQWAGTGECSIAHNKCAIGQKNVKERLRARNNARKSGENKWGEAKHENSLPEKKTQKEPPVAY